MRYNKEAKRDKKKDDNMVGKGNVIIPETMEQATENVVDQFQAVVFNAGTKTLSLLDAGELTEGLKEEARKKTLEDLSKAEESLQKLKTFRYNIGFAGPQSCGKSSMINAIIRYPLMPNCILATTCTPVELIYGKEERIIVKDDDRQDKIVFDRKCASLSQKDFDKLIDFACKVMPIAIIENLQFFCDNSVLSEPKKIRQHIHMNRSDPKQVTLLFLILLTVYVQQNSEKLTMEEEELNDLRLRTLSYFGIPKSTVNYTVIVQWDNPLLASGIMITDLPGLGSSAEDKQEGEVIRKGHNTITKDAVKRTDVMAFMAEPEVHADAVPLLKDMVSNANVLEAVSAEDRIIPIMNKVDLLEGAQKDTTIKRMLSMMSEAGANMEGRKVWETSSLCGEYAYEDLEVERSFFIQKEVYKLTKKGYSGQRIENRLPDILEDMNLMYKDSGIEELREFFRTAFVERGKYQKSLSSIVALRKLAVDRISPLRQEIEGDMVLAEVNQNIADEALKYLEEAAITPLNNEQKTDAGIIGLVNEHMGVIEPMLEGATAKYVFTLTAAVDDYADRLKKIADSFHLTYLGLGSRARVDAGDAYNHALYLKLIDESEKLRVDLTEVNKIHARALHYCSDTVERIYGGARDRLIAFGNSYPMIMKNCIEKYRKIADPDVITLMENMLPILQQFVSAQVLAADATIQNLKSSFQDAADSLAIEIIDLNDSLVSVLLNMIKGKLATIQGGWFTPKEFIVVDGENGLKATIASVRITDADRKATQGIITEKSSEVIVNPLRSWYQNAENDVNQIMSSLSLEIADQFNVMKENLKMKTEEREGKIKQSKKLLEKLCRIFSQMREDIQPYLDQILDLQGAGDSSMKGDLFEGRLETQGDENG